METKRVQPLIIRIEYGHSPKNRRRVFIRLFVWATIVGIAILAIRTVRTGIESLRSRMEANGRRTALYHELLACKLPSERPVFDELRDGFPVLLDGPNGATKYVRFRGDPGASPNLYIPPHHGMERTGCLWGLRYYDARVAGGDRTPCAPACFARPEVYGPTYNSYGGDIIDVFVHGRRISGGIERLVILTFNPSTFEVGDPQPLRVWVYSPGSSLRSGVYRETKHGLGFNCHTYESLRLFAGLPDPNDCSHFTIRYSAGVRSGVIDGWLTDDGNHVKLVARDEPPPIPDAGGARQ